MRPIRVGVLSCCTVSGGIGTAMLSRIVYSHAVSGVWLLPYAYLGLLGILLALLCSLCLVAVFGSSDRRGWALAVLCVLLGRNVPPIPEADTADMADIQNRGDDTRQPQYDVEGDLNGGDLLPNAGQGKSDLCEPKPASQASAVDR
jgi:hypothetical protein